LDPEGARLLIYSIMSLR